MKPSAVETIEEGVYELQIPNLVSEIQLVIKAYEEANHTSNKLELLKSHFNVLMGRA